MAEEREWPEIVRQLRSIEQTKSEKLQQLADLGSKLRSLTDRRNVCQTLREFIVGN
jgi:hypothetical protein